MFARETSETRKLNDRLREWKASRLQARTAEEVNSEKIVTEKVITCVKTALEGLVRTC